MITAANKKSKTHSYTQKVTTFNSTSAIQNIINKSWSIISPYWPLKDLVAVNPISGFEDTSFEKALVKAEIYFCQKNIPIAMQKINRESIKWLQAFFDEDQAMLQMPLRHLGLLQSTLQLIAFDKNHKLNKNLLHHLSSAAKRPISLVKECLIYLDVPQTQYEEFLTLMLTTLPGWSSYVKYIANWKDLLQGPAKIIATEYLAFRLALTSLNWRDAKKLLTWHSNAKKQSNYNFFYEKITKAESIYTETILSKLNTKKPVISKTPDAQIIFCIDVRSESIRLEIEAQGNYETYGYAGFFGLPISIKNSISGASYPSCPVLIKPTHKVLETPNNNHEKHRINHMIFTCLKQLYQSVKYTFTTPFILVESIGIYSGIWMLLKTFAPLITSTISQNISKLIKPNYDETYNLDVIPFEQQVSYALTILKTLDLTSNYAPLVLFCGHGSTNQNNAYKSILDCGACGGKNGSPNAKILANILNSTKIRQALQQYNINIPDSTHFLAAMHNTTTNNIKTYNHELPENIKKKVSKLKQHLDVASRTSCLRHSHSLGLDITSLKAQNHAVVRSKDWAQIRPEWGLARNAAFIIGPRWLTKKQNLDGRVFLHSYNWANDNGAKLLAMILTAPVRVAQWINSQYLFSTINNAAFGGGSKITKNITGKIGIIQGNASDLMHGLPLQSVYKTDQEPYHELIRLVVIVYAPKKYIDKAISQHEILRKLFGNGWLHLICCDPVKNQNFKLSRDLTWKITN